MPDCTLPETGLSGCRPVSATAGRLAARAAGRAFNEHMVPLIPAPGHTGRPAGKYPDPQMQKAGTGRPLKTHVKADRQPAPARQLTTRAALRQTGRLAHAWGCCQGLYDPHDSGGIQAFRGACTLFRLVPWPLPVPGTAVGAGRKATNVPWNDRSEAARSAPNVF